jgi:hypothetical protein
VCSCSLSTPHHFSFHYHALFQLYQLDITGPKIKIEIRGTIEVSPYTSGGDNAAFIEGFSSPRDVRRVSSLFDEPIASAISAISGSLDSLNSPIILPQWHPEIQPPLTGLLVLHVVLMPALI